MNSFIGYKGSDKSDLSTMYTVRMKSTEANFLCYRFHGFRNIWLCFNINAFNNKANPMSFSSIESLIVKLGLGDWFVCDVVAEGIRDRFTEEFVLVPHPISTNGFLDFLEKDLLNLFPDSHTRISHFFNRVRS